MQKNDSYFELLENKTLKVLFLLLFGAVITGLILIFRYFFWPFVFAVMLYLALSPVYDFILGLIKKRSITSALMILFLFLLILIPLFVLIAAIINQIFELYTIIQQQIEAGIIEDIYKSNITQKVIAYFNINSADLINRATDLVQKTSGKALSSARAVVSYPLKFLMNFIFLLLMLFFLFKDGHKLSALFYKTLPFPDDIEKDIVNRLKEVIRVLLTGNLLIMILQGLMVGIGLVIVGMPVALLGGSLAAILSLIPVVGTTFVWAPAVLYLVAVGSYVSAIFLSIWCLAWYLLLENLLKPKVFGERLHFHPVVFFFLLLGSIQAFSLPGVFIGPLLLTLFYSLWEIYKFLNEYGMYNNKKAVEATESEEV